MHEDFSQFDQEDEGIRLVITKNEQEVMRTISMINIQKLEEAIRIITASRRLILFARGFSEMVAQEMMIKFQLTEKYCELFTDPEIIKIMSKKLSPEDAVLFISLNGETPELVNAAQNCQQHNIATLLLTTAGESTLTSLSDVALVGFKSDGSFFPDYEVRSRLPLTILSRILLDSYALRKKEI
ncbi:RpiR family transcriptional regulator [Lactococcus garvieae TRF1]|uniref:RpiR family transcriptional regulator n=1 Tax=Lactococcus garvieae TRF1 TaxID=1380772 RepID=V8AP59_9LACT|nr:RpiR family transcriptional regulator [Lactococcus garvieae TRF1]